MEMMGQAVDLPLTQWGDPDSGETIPTLFRLVQARPVTERYEMLRVWSLPAVNRKSVRLIASFVSADSPPKVFGDISPLVPATISWGGDGAGIASTFGMLISAAKEDGETRHLGRRGRGSRQAKDGKRLGLEPSRETGPWRRETFSALTVSRPFCEELAKKAKPPEKQTRIKTAALVRNNRAEPRGVVRLPPGTSRPLVSSHGRSRPNHVTGHE